MKDTSPGRFEGGMATISFVRRLERFPIRLLAPALIFGLALRLFNLGERNTWYDEVSSILFAEKGLATIVEATAADTMPPLYYFVLHYWLMLGNNLWVARSLSVVLSLGMVAVAFAIARRLFGARVAFFAALLVAINPFQVYHGQEVRMYSLLGLSQLLAIYFLLRSLDYGSLINWAGFALSQTVAMYTHNAAFLSLATLDVLTLGVMAFSSIRPIRRISRLGLANLAIAALFLPWLVYLPGQLAKVGQAFWTEMPGVAELLRSIVVLTFNLPAPTSWSTPILLAVSLLFFALTVYSVGKTLWQGAEGLKTPSPLGKGEGRVRVSQMVTDSDVFEGPALGHPRRAQRAPALPLREGEGTSGCTITCLQSRTGAPQGWLEDNPGAVIFAAGCFLGPIAFAVLVSLARPIYVERALISSSAIYLILLAWAGERLRPRFVPAILLAALVVLSTWSLAFYYRYDGFPRVAFPRAVAYLEENLRPGDIILHDNKLTFFPGYYLNRNLPQRFLADPDWSINDTFARQTQEALGLRATSLDEAVEGGGRVWFVVFDRSLTEAMEQGRVNENMDWLTRRLELAAEHRFGDLSVYLFVGRS